MEPFPYHRIVVVGATSSGKSTLAKKLAEKIGGGFIELDALHWEPNWQEARPEVLRERVKAATSVQTWVVAGNYHAVRDEIWPKAEAIIWLDYSLPLVFWRLLTRTVRRWITREELWNGNRETFWWHFKIWSDDSLFHWLFKTYWRRKREYPILFRQPENSHLKVMHFTTPSETEDWFRNIELN
ncbi:MAG: adenylate kinase [Chloroflexi bacterium]|nr:adenylate kinase [Chloroflexota bacterium]